MMTNENHYNQKELHGSSVIQTRSGHTTRLNQSRPGHMTRRARSLSFLILLVMSLVLRTSAAARSRDPPPPPPPRSARVPQPPPEDFKGIYSRHRAERDAVPRLEGLLNQGKQWQYKQSHGDTYIWDAADMCHDKTEKYGWEDFNWAETAAYFAGSPTTCPPAIKVRQRPQKGTKVTYINPDNNCKYRGELKLQMPFSDKWYVGPERLWNEHEDTFGKRIMPEKENAFGKRIISHTAPCGSMHLITLRDIIRGPPEFTFEQATKTKWWQELLEKAIAQPNVP